MESNIEKFRDGLFSMNTRRFGKVAELMIKELYKFGDSDSINYDLKTRSGKKIEVKFSCVLKSCDETITKDNLIDSAVNSLTDIRALTFEDAMKNKFDCNIQQVKPKYFDYLYYGCFFKDKIMICGIKSEDVNESNTGLFYSPFQHKNNVGEGQFHINNKTIQYHLDNYFIKWLSYEELYNLFK